MKCLVKVTVLTMILSLFLGRVNALTVTKNTLVIDKGGSDKVELYANSDKEIICVEFTLVYSSYDVAANFIVNSNYTDGNPNGITHKVNFGEAISGKILLGNISINVKGNPNGNSGSINIHSAKGYTSEGESVALDTQIINVTIGKTTENDNEKVNEDTTKKEEKKDIDKNLLEKIESNIVKIDLVDDLFEYTVKIDKDVKELDLKAIAKDKDTKVEISNQKVEEIKDNKIIITASNGDIKQEYVINLKEKKDVEVTIDKSEFKEKNIYKSKWIIVSIVLVIGLIIGLVMTKKK